jgi:hypothetical protein
MLLHDIDPARQPHQVGGCRRPTFGFRAQTGAVFDVFGLDLRRPVKLDETGGMQVE